MTLFKALLSNPQIILNHENIFLLSHMRANTSLFGHLLGSHPLVEGYYEMHIGYYSWKSLWRQRLRHFANHSVKHGARFMFDKVLHDGHYVAPHLLQRKKSKSIFMLRAPEQSIKSLVVLYQKRNPDLPEATPAGAAQYYIDRLTTLAKLASAIHKRFYYLDAETLIDATQATLNDLSEWLEFTSPIPNEYKPFENTGKGNSGDHSNRLKSGQVSKERSDYSRIIIPPELMHAADCAYQTHRASLIEGSARHMLI